MDEKSKKAFHEWKKYHRWNQSYIPISGDFLQQRPIVCFFHEGDTMPYSVQYAGQGHYFKTQKEMERYYFEKLSKGRGGKK